MLISAFCYDCETNGSWPDLKCTLDRVHAQGTPPLLDPLEAEGRPIQRCFIHGYLWERSIGTEINTGTIWIFDFNGYYAHHEMEQLAIWIVDHDKMGLSQYKAEYPESRSRQEMYVHIDLQITCI